MTSPTALAPAVPADPIIRRAMLRTLAGLVDEISPQTVERLVHMCADDLHSQDRHDAWADLVEAVTLLRAVHGGEIEPRRIAPGAHPTEGHRIAGDVLEADIDAALKTLVGAA